MAITAQEKTDILNLSQQALAKITYDIFTKESIGDCPDADYLKAEYLSAVIRLLQTANDFTTAEFEKVFDCAAGIGEFNGFSVTTIGQVSTTILVNLGPAGPQGPQGIPGVSAVCVAVDKVTLDALIALDNLSACSTYYITDKYLYLQALSVDTVSLRGSFLARNADYQAAGVYTGVLTANGFTVDATGTNLGVWHSGLTPSAGDIVIYNNLHWLNLLGAVGTAPDADATNWEAVPNTDITVANTYGYIYEIDAVEYNNGQDWIQSRSDRRGNDITYSKSADAVFSLGSTGIDLFQWGRDSNIGNYVNEGYIDNLNELGKYITNQLQPGSFIKDNVTDALATIQANILGMSASIEGNTLGASSRIFSNTLTLGNTRIKDNTLGASANIQVNFLAGDNELSNKTLDPSINISGCTFGFDFNAVQTIIANITDQRVEKGFSNFIVDLDMDTAFSGGALTIPSSDAYVGIFKVIGSLSSYDITSIINFPENHPVEFRPAVGITTFKLTGTAAASAVATQIVLPISSVTYNGANKDRVTLQRITNVIFHNDSRQYL